MLAPTGRPKPVRGHHGILLAANQRLGGRRRGSVGQPGRAAVGVPETVRPLRAQVPDEQSGFRRLLHGHLPAAVGLRGPGVQREVLQLRVQLAKR